MIFSEFDTHCMQAALQQAQVAAEHDEVPVGAVLVFENKIIASGYNQPISSCDPTAHAEIVALRAAAKIQNNYRLVNTTMYVTLEPCAMCSMALLHARVKRIIYATPDPKTGALGGAIDLYAAHNWNHSVDCQQGLLKTECSSILKEFFQKKR